MLSAPEREMMMMQKKRERERVADARRTSLALSLDAPRPFPCFFFTECDSSSSPFLTFFAFQFYPNQSNPQARRGSRG